MSEGLHDYTVPKSWLYMARDVEDHAVCAFDDVLKTFLRMCLRDNTQDVDLDDLLNNTLESVLPVCESHRSDIAAYCAASATKEQDRYASFIDLFNMCLDDLKTISVKRGDGTTPTQHPAIYHLHADEATKIDIIFCRNAERVVDEEPHSGHITQLKPDILLTSKPAAARAHELDLEPDKLAALREIVQQEPVADGRFSWIDALSTFEFRLIKKVLPSPPEKYNSIELQEKIPAMGDIYAETPEAALKKLSETAASALPASASTKKEAGDGKDDDDTDSDNDDRLMVAPFSSGFTAARIHYGLQDVSSGSALRQIRDNEANERLKEAAASDRSDGILQPVHLLPVPLTAMYAAEMLSRTMTASSHTINLVVFDDVLFLWWFDHEGAIQSSGLNFVQDLPRFLVLLFAFQRFSLKDWGFVPQLDTIARSVHLARSTPRPNEDLEIPFSLEVGPLNVTIYPWDPVHRQYGLAGRGTRVLTATCKGGCIDRRERPVDPEQPLVVKIYWPDASRQSEVDLVDEVLEAASECGDLVTPEHMPRIFATQDYEELKTDRIRGLLNIHYRTSKVSSKEGYVQSESQVVGSRVLRLVVSEILHNAEEALQQPLRCFMTVFFESQKCHFNAWRYGIHHNDLSLPNLMWRYDMESKRVTGVLNDWDLGVGKKSRHADHGGVTGTVPFMSIDLLDHPLGGTPHLYRHDLEAMTWILTWAFLVYRRIPREEASATFDQGVTPRARQRADMPSELRDWLINDYATCARNKTHFLGSLVYRPPEPAEDFQEGWKLTVKLLYLLKEERHIRFKLVAGKHMSYEQEPDDPEKYLRSQWEVIEAHVDETGKLRYLLDLKPDEL